MKNLFITTILCLSLLLVPFGAVLDAEAADYYDGSQNPNIDDITIENNGIDGKAADDSYYKIAVACTSYSTGLSMSGGNTLECQFMLSDASSVVVIRPRFYTTAEQNTGGLNTYQRLEISKDKMTYYGAWAGSSSNTVQWEESISLDAGKWYTLVAKFCDYTLDETMRTAEYYIGDTKIHSGQTTNVYGYRGIGMGPKDAAHPIYVDNVVNRERIVLAVLDKVTGGDDEVNPVYTNNVIKVAMTQDMGTVLPEHITITRDFDGSDVPISSVSVSGKVITLTLGKDLQSVSTYTLTILETTPMKKGSTPIGQEFVVKFTTSARELDITDVTFTSDGSNASCVATVTNAAASDASVVIMMSAFDASGRVTGINYTTVAVNAVDSAASAPLQLPVTSGGYVKVLGIADFTTLAPLNNNIYTFRLE